MTDTAAPASAPAGAELNGAREEPLPLLITVTQAFERRLPSQRVMDAIARLEPSESFGELAQRQPFRIIAFRALIAQYPGDVQRLWLHSYDVEVDVVDAVDPTSGRSPTSSPILPILAHDAGRGRRAG